MSTALIESEEKATEKKEEKEIQREVSAGNELSEPRWAVVTFEAVAVSGLSYSEAIKWMEKLRAQKVSGLCIVTDEAANKFSK